MRTVPLVLALAAAATARADDARTLHLSVRGSVDGPALATAIARELGLEVAVADGVCDVPCLAVSVDGGPTATITYSPRSGAPRARAVALGNDAAQWPLVITLLAGNVVRDEAQDLLAGLPPGDLPRPEAPGDVPAPVQAPVSDEVAPPAPVVVPSPEASPHAGGLDASGSLVDPAPVREHRWLGLGLVPGLSTDLTHIGSVRHYLSIDLLVGVSGGSTGLSLSGVADIERGPVAGTQIGGVFTYAWQVAGTQVAGVAAVAGEINGVQVAGTAAVADRVDGFQIAGVAALSRLGAENQVAGVAAFAQGNTGVQVGGVAALAQGNTGVQIGGVAALAQGDAGVQIGGVAAVASGANVQVGGVASIARGTANVQVAGVVNVARRLRGVQIAPVNVAHDGDGIQVGVINVAGSPDGFSFGLVNIVPGGRHDLETAIDSNRTGTVLFRHGGRRWHNVYGIGGHPVNESGPNDDVWMYGLGFGPSLELGDTVIDLEAIGWQVNHGPRHESDVSILGQVRLSVAHRIGPVSLVAGGVFNAYITNDAQSPLILERSTSGAAMDNRVTVTTWPSAFVGVRL